MTTEPRAAGGPPSLAIRAAYAGVMAPMRIAWAPLLSAVPALYARHGGIDLKQLGLAMLALRLLDVVIDPMIGVLSDRTRSRWGARKPWLLAGALIVLPATWGLFAVPRDAGIAYVALFMALAYLGWSMVEIPHAAWLGDLGRGDAPRATLAGWRAAAISAGAVAYLALPLLPRFPDAAMTPAVLGLARALVVALLPPAVRIALLVVPDGGGITVARPGVGASLRGVIDSRVLRRLCGSILLASVASGMCAAGFFFYLDAQLGILGAFGYIGLAAAAVELPAGLAWPRLIAVIGARRGLGIVYASRVLILIAMALVPRGPGAAAAVALVFAVAALIAAGGGVAIAVIAAAAADKDARRTGSGKLANFMAATALCGKLGVALGGGAALLLGLAGFDAKGANGAAATAGFDATMFVVPGLLYLAAGATAWSLAQK